MKQLKMELFAPPEDTLVSDGATGNPTLPYPNPTLEERNKEIKQYCRPSEKAPALVSRTYRIPADLEEVFSILAKRLHYRLERAVAVAMLRFITENLDKIQDLGISVDAVQQYELDTKKQHTMELKQVSNLRHDPSPFYPRECPLVIGRTPYPKLCQECPHKWPRWGCVWPKKAEEKEAAFKRLHSTETKGLET